MGESTRQLPHGLFLEKYHYFSNLSPASVCSFLYPFVFIKNIYL